jgi:hypothetical protein
MAGYAYLFQIAQLNFRFAIALRWAEFGNPSQYDYFRLGNVINWLPLRFIACYHNLLNPNNYENY